MVEKPCIYTKMGIRWRQGGCAGVGVGQAPTGQDACRKVMEIQRHLQEAHARKVPMEHSAS